MSSPTRPPTPRWYWHAGLGAGDRQFVDVGDITTELGQTLPVRVAYESWGRLNARRDNAVLVEHALTGDSHVVGSASAAHPSAGWWEGLIGPGCPLDTDRYFVVASNVLGGCQGTTGPSSPGPHANRQRRATTIHSSSGNSPVPGRKTLLPKRERGYT